MAFAIRAEESVAKGVARVLRAQLECARDGLAPSAIARGSAIHEARKSLKKARALLRLVRGALGEAEYRRWNAECRDVARVVSLARDADVLLATFGELMGAYRGRVRAQTFRAPRRRLAAVARESRERVTDDAAAIRRNGSRVRALLGKTEALELACDGWNAIGPGLTRVYRRARRAYRESYRAPSDVAFHEWRKSVKYLRHQIDFVRDAWEKPLAELSDQLHELSNLLGTDHDLAMLRERVSADPASYGDEKTIDALYMLIERRQEELRERARPLGERLFTEKPRAFAARLGAYWKAWHRPHEYPPAHTHLVA